MTTTHPPAHVDRPDCPGIWQRRHLSRGWMTESVVDCDIWGRGEWYGPIYELPPDPPRKLGPLTSPRRFRCVRKGDGCRGIGAEFSPMDSMCECVIQWAGARNYDYLATNDLEGSRFQDLCEVEWLDPEPTP